MTRGNRLARLGRNFTGLLGLPDTRFNPGKGRGSHYAE